MNAALFYYPGGQFIGISAVKEETLVEFCFKAETAAVPGDAPAGKNFHNIRR